MSKRLLQHFRQLSCYDPGNWFQLPYVFLAMMPWAQAIFLAWLVMQVRMKMNAGHHKDGWVKISTKFIVRRLPITAQSVVRLFTGLTRKGYLRTRTKGIPPSRWILLDADAIDRDRPIETILSRTSQTEMSRTSQTEMSRSFKKKNNKKKNLGAAARTPTVSLWKDFSRELATAISTARKVNCSSKLSAWAQAFRKLHEVDGHEKERIQSILTWYCKMIKKYGAHLGQERIPEAWAGGSFREKFDRIEVAKVKRDNEEGISNEPTRKIKQTVNKASGKRRDNWF